MIPEKKYWFKAKSYGWGWTPVTWQGWTIVFGAVVLCVLNYFRIDSSSYSHTDTLMYYIPQTFILICLLVWICFKKGEKPRWRWGNRSDKDQHE